MVSSAVSSTEVRITRSRTASQCGALQEPSRKKRKTKHMGRTFSGADESSNKQGVSKRTAKVVEKFDWSENGRRAAEIRWGKRPEARKAARIRGRKELEEKKLKGLDLLVLAALGEEEPLKDKPSSPIIRAEGKAMQTLKAKTRVKATQTLEAETWVKATQTEKETCWQHLRDAIELFLKR